ncbi:MULTISPECIES: hypothetical protein [Bacillati]|jgi:hypothetical protein|uniref:hypothetical protein n=1 Tax=Bacillati TaxID=1783272 RepID=UPI003F8B0312
MPSLRLSKEFMLNAMQAPGVRAALRDKAEEIAREVNAEVARDDYYVDVADRYKTGPPELDVTVGEGTRPGGRPYARVSVPQEDEWGDYNEPKRRVLGRLAARHNTPKGG